MISRAPIVPGRVRRIAGQSFAFVPHRFLRDGFLASLSHGERSLYLFLLLAADRAGLSFYAYDTICSLLQMTLEDYVQARNGLIHKDLIAFDGTRFQVLSLPDTLVTEPARPCAPRTSSMTTIPPPSASYCRPNSAAAPATRSAHAPVLLCAALSPRSSLPLPHWLG